jgi:hypothetical protein
MPQSAVVVEVPVDEVMMAMSEDRLQLRRRVKELEAALKRDQAERDKWRADWATLYHEHSGTLARLGRIADLLAAHKPDELDLAECRQLAKIV